LIGGVSELAIKIPIESLTISILESELNETFDQQQMIEFPLWLLAAVLGFSVVITTLATVLPAWRAARIDPIAALRHD
jgi:ABC-type lipoprotein release transport system permease subunit